MGKKRGRGASEWENRIERDFVPYLFYYFLFLKLLF
jgi:hypothetical protein